MTLVNFDVQKIRDLVYVVSALTKLRVVVFDCNHNVVAESQIDDCSYCKAIHQNAVLARECVISDKEAFNKNKYKKSIVSYKCHAGLIETMMTLYFGDQIIGYVMLGQFCDKEDVGKRKKDLIHYLDDLNISEKEKDKIIEEVPYKSKEELAAVSTLLTSLSEYIIEESLVTTCKKKFISELDTIINENISSTKITSDFIAHKMNISRTALYSSCKTFLRGSLGDRIQEKRLTLARKLLKESTFSVTEIAEKCGFSDYKYFIKVFKEKYKITPIQYRKNYHKNV